MLVVRDDEKALRAYRNVCRHRGSCLLSGSGQCKGAIRCRYHGWTYKFDGTLIGAPEARQFGERLNKSALGLMGARVEELCGLVFVNLDPDATPLADLVGDLPARLAPYRIPTLEPFGASGGTQPANWKVVAENYLEGYHIPIAHPGADADARLQALRHRSARALRVDRGAAPGEAEQQLGRARRMRSW